jgi:hypothetical protein
MTCPGTSGGYHYAKTVVCSNSVINQYTEVLAPASISYMWEHTTNPEFFFTEALPSLSNQHIPLSNALDSNFLQNQNYESVGPS